MRLDAFLCLGGVEISNQARVATYVNNVGVPGVTMGLDCACSILDEGFDLPSTDPAPWYESTRPESADFLGFYASSITMEPVFGRSVAERGGIGSIVGPLRAKGRIMSVEGLMISSSAQGQAYGERWLSEALRGSPCEDGGCGGSDLLVLPACPDDSYDSDSAFRTLVNVAVVDGPIFASVVSNEHAVQQAAFTLVSDMPYLYHPVTRCLDEESLDYNDALSCSLTTPEWMGDGTFVIDITNDGVVDLSDVTIEGRISLDGSCPVSGLGTSVMPSFSYAIPTLEPEARIVIDGKRRQVLSYDASEKLAKNGLRYVEWGGPFRFPDVGVCTTMCVTIEASSGSGIVTVESVLREM